MRELYHGLVQSPSGVSCRLVARMRTTSGDDDDRRLLSAWRAGDRKAGSALFRRYAPAITCFFRNKLPCAEDSNDLMQETFLGLARSEPGGAQDPESVRRYLYAIARNVLCAHLRRRYKQEQEKVDFTTACVKDLAPSSLSSIVLQRRRTQVFVEALREVPLDDQILLEFKYFDELSAREIAGVLEVPETTLHGRLQRAKARLQEKYRELSSRGAQGQVASPTEDELEQWAQEVRERVKPTADAR